MKKIFTSMIIVATLLISGCGSDGQSDDKNENSYKIGQLVTLNSSEDSFDKFLHTIEEFLNIKLSSRSVINFNNLDSMISALQNGQINEIAIYRSVARHLISKDPNLTSPKNNDAEFVDTFCFGLRENDSELCDEIDTVIKHMKADGTLDALEKKYILDFSSRLNPIEVELPRFYNEPTIKVAVSADLPPLDYLDYTEKNIGFEIAVLAEIGKRLQKNIELIRVDFADRLMALTSKQVDVIFWSIIPISEIMPADSDTPAEIKITEPFYRDKIVRVRLVKESDKK